MLKIHLLLTLILLSLPSYSSTLWQIIDDNEDVISRPVNKDSISAPNTISLNRSLFLSLSPDKTANLPINRSLSYLVKITRIKQNANGSNTYIGEINGSKKPYPVIITVGENSFYGLIATGGRTYALEGRKNIGTIYEHQHNNTLSDDDYSVPLPINSVSSFGDLISAKKTTNIDFVKQNKADVISNIANIKVLFVFNQSVKEKYGGSPLTRIHHVIEVSNQILSNSGVYINIELAATLEVDYPDNTSLLTALEDITNASLSTFTSIRKLRYEMAADMVIFSLVSSNYLYAGYAWTNGKNGNISMFKDNMYSAIYLDQPDYVAVHELGHNLGLHHSRKQTPFKGVTFDFALGYGVDYQFATVMAYPSAFSTLNKIYRFSNPDLECEFLPCGIASQNTSASADASYALNLVRFQAQDLYQDNPSLMLTQSSTLNLSDQALQACINGLNSTDIYSYAGMINDIDCRSNNIDSLTGISVFENLHTINLSNNFVTDLAPIEYLKKLQWLSLQANNVHDISALFHLNEWDSLNLLDNPIYCWQLLYFDKFETVYNWYPPAQCDDSDDLNDYDYDGTSNLVEINNDEDPTINNNGSGKLKFGQQLYRFDEQTGSIQIQIERVEGNLNTLKAYIEVQDQNTKRGTDYIIIEQSLSFEHGERTGFIELKVIDDEEIESKESFSIKLISSNNTDITNIEIIDNDYRPSQQVNKSSGGGAYSTYLLYVSILIFLLKRLLMNTSFKRCTR